MQTTPAVFRVLSRSATSGVRVPCLAQLLAAFDEMPDDRPETIRDYFNEPLASRIIRALEDE